MNDQSVKIFDRLHQHSYDKDIAGKERRLKIERKIAERHEIFELPSKKIPLSQANDFYDRSIRRTVETEEKLRATAFEKKQSYKTKFNFIQHNSRSKLSSEHNNSEWESRSSLEAGRSLQDGKRCEIQRSLGNITEKKIPASQADDMYLRSIKLAREKNKRLAEKVQERDSRHRVKTIQIPLSRADDFYRRSIQCEIEKKEKLSAAAFERNGIYESKFNFNQPHP